MSHVNFLDIETHNKILFTKEQMEISSKVVILDDEVKIEKPFSMLPSPIPSHSNFYFGGVDVSFTEDEKEDSAVAVYVVIDSRTMKIVYQESESFLVEVPYIPSFLAFREIAPLERLVKDQLRLTPEVTPRAILVDGNGVLHPRRAGIACFLGIRTGIPTIGIGKTLFCEGDLTKEGVWSGMDRLLSSFAESAPNEENRQGVCFSMLSIAGPSKTSESHAVIESSRHELVDKVSKLCLGLAIPLDVQSRPTEKTTRLGCLLVGHGGRVGRQTKQKSTGTKVPIFVSVGHGLSLQSAVGIAATLSLSRIPEPVRQADLIGREILRRRTS